MKKQAIKAALAITGIGIMLSSPLAISHFDDKAIPQSYRQSFFALLAANFGPLAAMVKGEMTWNAESFQHFADDLATVASLDIARGFPEGTHTGQTRAKPEIWENKADFDSKMGDLKEATMALKIAAATGDKGKIMEAFKATGGACKACHDDYKSKNYLN